MLAQTLCFRICHWGNSHSTPLAATLRRARRLHAEAEHARVLGLRGPLVSKASEELTRRDTECYSRKKLKFSSNYLCVSYEPHAQCLENVFLHWDLEGVKTPQISEEKPLGIHFVRNSCQRVEWHWDVAIDKVPALGTLLRFQPCRRCDSKGCDFFSQMPFGLEGCVLKCNLSSCDLRFGAATQSLPLGAGTEMWVFASLRCCGFCVRSCQWFALTVPAAGPSASI